MIADDTLGVEIDWLDGVEATPAELRTTWAAMSITVGDQTLTQVRHRSTGSSRRTLHVSTYPLALWVASNWWRLSEDERPFEVPESEWSFLKPRQAWQTEPRDWLVAHNLRAAGGGMPLPDATLVSHGALMRIRWFAGYTPDFERVQFLTSGAAWLDRESTLAQLASLVDETLSRLDESGVSDTALHDEWAAVQLSLSDEDTRPYCIAIARLGMDPYDPEVSLEAELQAAEGLLSPATFNELTHAVAVEEFTDAVAWLSRARQHQQAVVAARPLLHIGLAANGTEPWLAGYKFAERYRAATEGGSKVFPVMDYVTTSTLPGGTRSVEASVAVTDERITTVVSHASPERGQRFLAARAILLGEVTPQTIVTRSSSWLQQASRAFAAELLAPAELLRELLSEERTPSSEEIEQVADELRVSPMLVEHQIENRLLRRAAL